MTLGNDPQPLTRRQLRELARENEPSAAESGSSDAPAAHHSRHTPERDSQPAKAESTNARPVERAEAARPVERAEAARPAPAPLPIPDQAPANMVVIDSVPVDPGRTLTRRELRALQAAASASPESAETGRGDAEAPPAAPASSASQPGAAARTVAPGLPVGVAATAAAADGPVGSSTGSAAESASSATGLNPPLGHWSVDRDDDSHIQTIGRRDDQTFDDLVGRGIGAGGIPTTTNALILPAIPRQGTAGPITSTGEIMITGSIDLPRSLGATGQHPNLFDSSEMDRMLDQLDEGGHHNDVAPVSASRAVSTHTSTRGVMTPPRKRGASLPTVLAITAAVLAIGVLSLFVVGYAFNIY
jgi:hypothetical protein